MLRTDPEARHENAAPDPGGAATNRTSSRHYHGLDLLRSVALLLGVILRLKFEVQHPRPAGHRMLRWTDEASTSAARNVA